MPPALAIAVLPDLEMQMNGRRSPAEIVRNEPDLLTGDDAIPGSDLEHRPLQVEVVVNGAGLAGQRDRIDPDLGDSPGFDGDRPMLSVLTVGRPDIDALMARARRTHRRGKAPALAEIVPPG